MRRACCQDNGRLQAKQQGLVQFFDVAAALQCVSLHCTGAEAQHARETQEHQRLLRAGLNLDVKQAL